jgi:hypothetical protein
VWTQSGTFKPYPYENHTLTVDFKTGGFRVLYTNFKNASNDFVVEASSVQTSYPNGSVVIQEANYTKILYGDEN